MNQALAIRDIRPEEKDALGKLMVDVYSNLEGFPSPSEQPRYYEMLANIGELHEKPGARVLVALKDDRLLGGVVYFSDMAAYASGSTATSVKNASDIRLLAVSPEARGLGVGKALTVACIERARQAGHERVVLHSTQSMRIAWGLYERLGFQRWPELDFQQEQLPVFGFCLRLD